MNKAKYYVGLMSGTSVDGIDAALLKFDSETEFEVVETHFTPFPSSVESSIRSTALNNEHLTRCEDSHLHSELAEYYAQAAIEVIDKSGIEAALISAIANHGQTVKHAPPLSIQLGDGQEVADLTSLPCICDFRQADLKLGGQGAPLMPAFHRALFSRKQTEGENDICLVNIGGIANISLISEPLIGFDSGPGNCLMDMWIQSNQQVPYDKDGSWATSGEVEVDLLSTLLDDSFFSDSPPKSTGTDYFNLDWLSSMAGTSLEKRPAENIQRTLLQLTVESIRLGVQSVSTGGKIYLCGGGAQNNLLRSELCKSLPEYTVGVSAELGISEDYMEAAGFAWLGYCHDEGIPANEPSVTGACRKAILGKKFSPQT